MDEVLPQPSQTSNKPDDESDDDDSYYVESVSFKSKKTIKGSKAIQKSPKRKPSPIRVVTHKK